MKKQKTAWLICYALNALAEFYANSWGDRKADSTRYLAWQAINIARRLQDRGVKGAKSAELAAMNNLAIGNVRQKHNMDTAFTILQDIAWQRQNKWKN